MRIRNKSSFTPSALPSPAYLSLSSSTPSQNQGTVTRELHPCETLLRRLREISLLFHQRSKRTPKVPVKEIAEEGRGQQEQETKQVDPKLQQHAPEKGEEKAVISIEEDGSASTEREEKNSSLASSDDVSEGTWLEEEKCFPLKKRKNNIPWETFTVKDLKIKTTMRDVMITENPKAGVDKKLGVQGMKMKGPDGKHGNGVASKKNEEMKKKSKDVSHGPKKAGSRRASIVIEGMKMTSNPAKREESPVPIHCTIAKMRVRAPSAEIKEGRKIPKEPNNKKGDAKMGKVQAGVTPNSIADGKRKSVTTISDEEERKRAARDYAVIGRRGSRKQLVIDEEEKEEIEVARSLVELSEDGEIKKGKRCTRYNGRGWRCRRTAKNGHALCNHHLRRARMKSKGGAANVDPPPRQNNGGDVEPRTSCKRKGKDAVEEEEEEVLQVMVMMMMKKRGRREASFNN